MFGIQRSIDLFIHRSEIGHRQCGVGAVNYLTKRWEEGLRRSANPHIKGAASVVASKKGKIRLLRILAKPTIAKIRHNADDFNVRLNVRSGTLTDSQSQWTSASQVALHERFVHDGRAPAFFARRRRIAFIEVSSLNDFYSQGLEESRRNRVQIDVAVSRDSLVRKNRHRIVPASASQQCELSYCRSLGDGRLTDRFIDTANQPVSFRWGVSASQRINTE
jgi:hypothetical protein